MKAIGEAMTHDELVGWLKERDERRLASLYEWADRVRARHVGDEVHLRGLVEISNWCARECGYCGLRFENEAIERYRMGADEIVDAARRAKALGYGTVVLQSGEDYALTTAFIEDVVRRIKSETRLAVTLSLGERDEEEFARWRAAGADRYLLRFETSDRDLYDRIHPPLGDRVSDRFEILRTLRRLGYEVGSGIMIGIPGQTYDVVANDIAKFRELDLDMIGVGPYIAHPQTPLGRGEWRREVPAEEQVPNDEEMVYKVLALTRLACPEANLPSTTALATLNKADGREKGLSRGANVVMPNVTPPEYRVKYEIYPDKACVNETAEQCAGCLAARIASLGRVVGQGHGGRRRALPRI